ncbi:MAG: hypothetical protein EAZ55_06260 [Cytophagales bacterium]|nr:MAG: hypothetical protein EAZ55_06260 [Cytophagales bacterium]
MINYDSKNWLNNFIRIFKVFNLIYTSRTLTRYLFWVLLYSSAVTFIEVEIIRLKYQLSPMFFSLVAIILSLVLVFRLNTAYDKWWEARKLWGTLINESRAAAAYFNAILPKKDNHNRQFFASHLSNFAFALKGHLRGLIRTEELEDFHDNYISILKKKSNLPLIIVSQMMTRIEELVKQNIISETDKRNLKGYIDTFIHLLGSCERIKNTPIPFSHNTFIKSFIFIYTLALPFGLASTFLYYAIPATILISYALIGVEVISEEIEDPFGNEANDLPLTHFSNIIKKSMHDVLQVWQDEDEFTEILKDSTSLEIID